MGGVRPITWMGTGVGHVAGGGGRVLRHVAGGGGMW